MYLVSNVFLFLAAIICLFNSSFVNSEYTYNFNRASLREHINFVRLPALKQRGVMNDLTHKPSLVTAIDTGINYRAIHLRLKNGLCNLLP